MTETPTLWRGIKLLVVSPTPTHPQDHGNRKRIFELCSELKRQGAFIHFAHYASEHDWRHARPLHAEQQMREVWDAYDLIAPSRGLHLAALAPDHGIDEWADPSLTAFVGWACRIHNYDAVIVNYTWLSFCLEAVPAQIFKILDTHDAFGRRRSLLNKLGVENEFFHTTPEEEAKALARADLVWAIKDDEREYFEQELGAKNCLTVLHAEPETRVWRNAPRPDGFLRAGVIGARNNVNRRNLERFLQTALPLFSSYLADVKIAVAGGCADDFAGQTHPNIEVIGRVDQIEDFYGNVDVVIAPIASSTGLKIKVSEAFAAGAPLVALAHATEGYPTLEPSHLLPDFAAMAMELIKLAFDREPLEPLARQSHQVWAAIRHQVLVAIEQTRQQIIKRDKDRVCVVAPVAALDPRSVLYDHLFAALQFIRQSNPVSLFLTGPAAIPNDAIIEHFGRDLRIFADPAVIAALGPRAPGSWSAVALGDLFESRGFQRAYLMADCARSVGGRTGVLKRVYLRHDAVTIAGGDADALVQLLRPLVPVVLMSVDRRAIGRWDGMFGIAGSATVPFRQIALLDCFTIGETPPDAAPLLVLASPYDPLLPALQDYADRLGAAMSVLDPGDLELAVALLNPASSAGDPRAIIGGAKLAVDLGSAHPLAAVIGESLRRAGVPVITPLRGPAAAAMQSSPDICPASLLRLLRVIALGLADGDYAAQLRIQTARQTKGEAANSGWYWFWKDLDADLNASPGSDLEGLFGPAQPKQAAED